MPGLHLTVREAPRLFHVTVGRESRCLAPGLWLSVSLLVCLCLSVSLPLSLFSVPSFDLSVCMNACVCMSVCVGGCFAPPPIESRLLL